MKKNMIMVCAGDYSNVDVYERVLGYIIQKDYIGGYGFPIPADEASVLKEFHRCEGISNYDNNQKLWHFIVSLPKIRTTSLLCLAEKTAQIFSGNYDFLYGIDLDPGHYHIHFAVNTYGCCPNVPALTPKLFHSYLSNIRQFLLKTYPHRDTVIFYKGENKIYV